MKPGNFFYPLKDIYRNEKKSYRNQFFIFLGVGLLHSFYDQDGDFSDTRAVTEDFAVTCLFWVCLPIGNGFLAEWPSYYLSWTKEPIKRLLAGITTMLIGSTTIIFTLITLYLLVYKGFSLNRYIFLEGYLPSLKLSLIITTVMWTLMHARSFLMHWRQSAIDAEKLRSESVASRYQSLKNQLNPHFLFNSLNALTNLVYENQDQAARFIRKLSDVYRYTLDVHQQEVVPLKEELKFLESYVFLQKIRHEEGVNVDIRLGDCPGCAVPPMAIQLLVENAIKHNEISDDNPLHIRIVKEADYLVVTNNLQRKTIREHVNGMGLTNIRARYALLSNRPVTVEETATEFRVQVPLLTVKETQPRYASSHH